MLGYQGFLSTKAGSGLVVLGSVEFHDVLFSIDKDPSFVENEKAAGKTPEKEFQQP